MGGCLGRTTSRYISGSARRYLSMCTRGIRSGALHWSHHESYGAEYHNRLGRRAWSAPTLTPHQQTRKSIPQAFTVWLPLPPPTQAPTEFDSMTQPPPTAPDNPDNGDAGALAPDIVERLCSLPNALGRLAIAYRSRTSEDGTGWVDDFFRASARNYLLSPSVPTEQALGIDPESEIDRLSNAPLPETAQPLKLLSLRSHYFRGFLAADAPVDLSGGLIVVYGRNSHGKTSFAESLEWLLTGTLSRRSKGDARELEKGALAAFSDQPPNQLGWRPRLA